MRKLLSIIISLVFAVSAYAQQVQIKDYSDFRRGLNVQHTPINLPDNFCTVAENIRFGSELKSIKTRPLIYTYGTASTTDPITGMHRLYTSAGEKVLIITHGMNIKIGSDTTGAFTSILTLTSADYKWQWLTWHNIAIGTDGYNQPVKYDGSSASATYLGSCLATDSGSGSPAYSPDGTYTYKISYYTASYEVILDTPSNTITVIDKDINLTMIPIAPTTYGGEDVVGRKVYRTTNSGSTYYLLSNGTIANNTATTLTDSDTDGDLTVTAYPAGDATYKPPKGKLSLVHSNRLFIANNPDYPSRIYYSESGSHDIFLSNAYFNIRPNDGDEITFVKNLYGIITIAKNNTIQKLYTDGATPSADWSISDPFSYTGCQAMYSAANTPFGIMYLADDGIYQFTGQQSKLISESVTPIISDINKGNYNLVAGAYYKNLYYLAYTSAATGASLNNRVLILDTLTNSYTQDLLGFNAFTTFSSGTDTRVLYAGSSTNGAVYSYSAPGAYELIHKRHSDFTGTFDDMRYIPTTAGGDSESPVLELAWTETIDDVATTINATSGIIDRPDTDGTYTSQILNLNALYYDKLYWNELIPITGGDIKFSLRAGATTTDCVAASWSSDFTDPTGSDISGETANTYVQYRISASTDNIAYTPTIIKRNNYNIKLDYNLSVATPESSVLSRWESGETDFGAPVQDKLLRKLKVFHLGTSGSYTITFENEYGDTDSFTVNLSDDPKTYEEYFTNGAFRGRMIKVKISYNNNEPLTIRRILITHETEPYV